MMYLQTPSCVIDVPPCQGEAAIAVAIIDLLMLGEDWVRLCTRERGWQTQWTVLERNAAGRAVQFAYAEFDGSTGVLSADGF